MFFTVESEWLFRYHFFVPSVQTMLLLNHREEELEKMYDNDKVHPRNLTLNLTLLLANIILKLHTISD
jgi:hypothetical protein